VGRHHQWVPSCQINMATQLFQLLLVAISTFRCHSCKLFWASCQLPYTPTGSYKYIHREEINVHHWYFWQSWRAQTSKLLHPKQQHSVQETQGSRSTGDTRVGNHWGQTKGGEGALRVMEFIASSIEYMKSNQVQMLTAQICDICRNKHELCSFWAVIIGKRINLFLLIEWTIIILTFKSSSSCGLFRRMWEESVLHEDQLCPSLQKLPLDWVSIQIVSRRTINPIWFFAKR
jgi:hypothetical protein